MYLLNWLHIILSASEHQWIDDDIFKIVADVCIQGIADFELYLTNLAEQYFFTILRLQNKVTFLRYCCIANIYT